MHEEPARKPRGPRPSFGGLRALEGKLLVMTGGLLLVVIVVYTWAAWHAVREAELGAADERLERVAVQIADGVTRAPLDELEAVAAGGALAPLLERPLDDLARTTAGEALAAIDGAQVIETLLVAPDGSVVLRTPGTVYVADVAGFEPWIPGEHDTSTARRGMLRAGLEHVFYDLWAPIDRPDDPVGYVVQRRLVAPVEANLELIESFVGSDAAFLIGNAEDEVWTDLRTVVPGPPAGIAAAGSTLSYRRAGSERVGYAVAIEESPWAILIEFPVATVLQPARQFLTRCLLTGAALLCVVGLVALLLGRRLITPLQDLSAAAEAIADGDYGRRVDVHGDDEVGALAASFNRMAEEVESARRRDASRRAAAEVARERSEEYFRALVENSLDIVVVVGPRGCLRFVSPSVQRLLGHDPEELDRGRLAELIHPSDRDRLEQLVGQQDGESQDIEFRCRDARGDWRVLRGVACDLRHNPVIGGVLINLRDVTGSLELEEQLRQAHKMEAVGRLAGGIAHDFNNLLTAMHGSLEFMRRDYDLPPAALADLEQASTAATRAGELVRQLLAFGRQQAIEPSVVDPNSVIASVSRMLARVVGEDVRVETELADEIAAIRVDRNQFEQVLLNLAVNARDAMPDGGTLALSTVLQPADERSDGPHVRVRVSDDGVGMDDATRERIFEPFFTTKPEGKGTGLGLSTVYGILRQSGARIEVHSAPGEGTRFDLFFPALEAAASELVESIDDTEAAVTRLAGVSILVVEDQDYVAAFVERALRSRGCRVRSSANAADALDAIREAPADFDLLLTDVVLPDARGQDLATAARMLRPELPVLLMTGYDRSRVQGPHDHPVLEKPFTLDALGEAIGQVLSGRAGEDRSDAAAAAPSQSARSATAGSATPFPPAAQRARDAS